MKKKTIGKLTLFHNERKPGKSVMSGYMETEKGKYEVYLYPEMNDNVTNGEYLRGPVYARAKSKE